MQPEVRSMIDVRHQAEQRGHFAPLGRLLYLETAHGTIQFPVEMGEGTGPDLAFVLRQMAIPEVRDESQPDGNTLVVLGEWLGLPPVRRSSDMPCLLCKHDCDICDGGGKKICEGYQCGGTGWVPGPFQLCTAAGCSAEKGRPNPEGCEVCHGAGQVPEHLVCPMCEGTKLMTCSRCKGTGKFSTGFQGGSLDYKSPQCDACQGTGYQGMYVMQDVKKFTNAVLQYTVTAFRSNLKSGRKNVRHGSRQEMLVLGPIHRFAVSDFQSSRTRLFDVNADSLGDFLVLLVPATARQKPQKAYLVGGIIRERVAQAAHAS
jgi:hypothetical protein